MVKVARGTQWGARLYVVDGKKYAMERESGITYLMSIPGMKAQLSRPKDINELKTIDELFVYVNSLEARSQEGRVTVEYDSKYGYPKSVTWSCSEVDCYSNQSESDFTLIKCN